MYDVVHTLSEFFENANQLRDDELASTVIYFHQISDLLLSHGDSTEPCSWFLRKLLSSQTRDMNPAAGEGMFSELVMSKLYGIIQLFHSYDVRLLGKEFFWHLRVFSHEEYKLSLFEHIACFRLKIPFYAMALNACDHRQYYRALANLRETATVMAELIINTEQDDVVEAWTEDIRTLEWFIQKREAHSRPLKHIARLRISDLLNMDLPVDASDLPLPGMMREYIISYRD